MNLVGGADFAFITFSGADTGRRAEIGLFPRAGGDAASIVAWTGDTAAGLVTGSVFEFLAGNGVASSTIPPAERSDTAHVFHADHHARREDLGTFTTNVR